MLQVADPSQARKLSLYFANEATRRQVFLNGGADELEELPSYPGANHSQEFMLMRRLAVTPLRFKRWLDESFIRFSIMRVFFLAESTATDNEVGAFYMRF